LAEQTVNQTQCLFGFVQVLLAKFGNIAVTLRLLQLRGLLSTHYCVDFCLFPMHSYLF